MEVRFKSSASVFRTVLGLAVLVSTRPAAHAQIVDGSFEAPVISAGNSLFFAPGTNIGPWTVVGPSDSLMWLMASSYVEPQNQISAFTAEQGQQSLDLTGPGNDGPDLGIQQTFATATGQNYTLTFYVGKAESAGDSPAYTDPAVADVSIDGGLRTSFTNAASGASGTVVWQQFTDTFTAAAPTTTLSFFNGTNSPHSNYVGLDNVNVSPTSSTPEPGVVGLAAGFGLPSLLLALKRRRR